MTQLPATTRQRSHAPTALDEAMDRMAAILEQETALLRENRVVELTEFNHRKRQGLLEINRLLRNFAPGDAERVAPARVCRLARLARRQPEDARASPQGGRRNREPGGAGDAGSGFRRHLWARRRLRRNGDDQDADPGDLGERDRGAVELWGHGMAHRPMPSPQPPTRTIAIMTIARPASSMCRSSPMARCWAMSSCNCSMRSTRRRRKSSISIRTPMFSISPFASSTATRASISAISTNTTSTALTRQIATMMNQKLGEGMVKEVLVQEFAYMPKEQAPR